MKISDFDGLKLVSTCFQVFTCFHRTRSNSSSRLSSSASRWLIHTLFVLNPPLSTLSLQLLSLCNLTLCNLTQTTTPSPVSNSHIRNDSYDVLFSYSRMILFSHYYYYISYSFWHRLGSTHARVAIYYIYERKTFWGIKTSPSPPVAESACRMERACVGTHALSILNLVQLFLLFSCNSCCLSPHLTHHTDRYQPLHHCQTAKYSTLNLPQTAHTLSVHWKCLVWRSLSLLRHE